VINPKRYEIRCQLLFITNRKLHIGFRLVSTLMILNTALDLILRFSPNLRFSGRLYHSRRQTYNVRKILSPSSSLPFLAKTITHPAARSLCDSCAFCCCLVNGRVNVTRDQCMSVLFGEIHSAYFVLGS